MSNDKPHLFLDARVKPIKKDSNSYFNMNQDNEQTIDANIIQQPIFISGQSSETLRETDRVKSSFDSRLASSQKEQFLNKDNSRIKTSEIGAQQNIIKRGNYNFLESNAFSYQQKDNINSPIHKKTNFDSNTPIRTTFNELMLQRSCEERNVKNIRKRIRVKQSDGRVQINCPSVTLTDCIRPYEGITRGDFKERDMNSAESIKKSLTQVFFPNKADFSQYSIVEKKSNNFEVLPLEQKQLVSPNASRKTSRLIKQIHSFSQNTLNQDTSIQGSKQAINLNITENQRTLSNLGGWKLKRGHFQKKSTFIDQKLTCDSPLSPSGKGLILTRDDQKFQSQLSFKRKYQQGIKTEGCSTTKIFLQQQDKIQNSDTNIDQIQFNSTIETAKRLKDNTFSANLPEISPLMNATQEYFGNANSIRESESTNSSRLRMRVAQQGKLTEINPLSSQFLNSRQFKSFNSEQSIVTPLSIIQNSCIAQKMKLSAQNPASLSYLSETNKQDQNLADLIKSNRFRNFEEDNSSNYDSPIISGQKKILSHFMNGSQFGHSSSFSSKKTKLSQSQCFFSAQTASPLLQNEEKKKMNFSILIEESNFKRNSSEIQRNLSSRSKKFKSQTVLYQYLGEQIQHKDDIREVCILIDSYQGEIKELFLKSFSKNTVLSGLMNEYCLISKEEFIGEMMRFLRFVIIDFRKDNIQVISQKEAIFDRNLLNQEQMKFPMIPKLLVDWICSHLQINVKNLANKLKKTNPLQKNFIALEAGFKEYLKRFHDLANTQLLPHGVFEELGGIRGLRRLLEELCDLIAEEIQKDSSVLKKSIEDIIDAAGGMAKDSYRQLIEYVKQDNIRLTSAEFFIAKKVLLNMLYEGRAIQLNSSISLLSEDAVKSIVESIEVSRSIMNNRSHSLLGGSFVYEISHLLTQNRIFQKKIRNLRFAEQFVKELCESIFMSRTIRLQFSQKIEKAASEPLDKQFYDVVKSAFFQVLSRPEFKSISSPPFLVDLNLNFYLLEVDLQLNPKPVFSFTQNIDGIIENLFSWVEDQHFTKGSQFNFDLLSCFDRRFMSFFLRSALVYGGHSAVDTQYSIKCYKVMPDILSFWKEGLNEVISKCSLIEEDKGSLKQFLNELLPLSLYED